MACKRGKDAMYSKPVVIVGRPFRVVYQDEIIGGDGMLCDGLMDAEKEIIYIKNGQTPAQQEEAMVHEIIEALNHAGQYRMRHPVIMGLARGLWAAGVRYVEPGGEEA